MRSENISRGLLSDQVYDLIRSSILDGTRVPGSRLVESDIARRLEVSQAPVREAVKRLVHEGLVISEARKGSYVTEFSREEFELARELRAVVEALGARISATSSSEAELDELELVVDQMAEAVGNNDWARFRLDDIQFHAQALSLARRSVLGRVWSALEPALISQRAIGDPAFAREGQTMVAWHADLVAVLRSRNPERASDMFHAHAAGALPAPQSDPS